MICTQGGPCEFCLHWPLFLKHSIYSECCCSSYKWHSKICSYFRLCPRLASLAPYSIAHTVQTFSLMRNRLAGVARTYLRSHPQCFLHFTCQELLVIFQSWSDNYFALRSAVTQAPGALSMLDPQLWTVFHSTCSWNYYPSHLSSCGNVLRLFAGPSTDASTVESAADLVILYNYLITLHYLEPLKVFTSTALIVSEIHFCLL